MKKTLSILILFFSVLAFAQDEGIKFEDNLLFSELLAKAKKEKKIIFIDAFASWCGPCKLMAKNVFPQTKVKDYFNTNFINARFDMEKGEGPDLALKYGVRSYPTFLFLNPEGEVVGREMGYMPADNFLDVAKGANNPNNKAGSLKEQFEKGASDPNFLMNIINSNATTDYDFAKKASERYFQNKKNPEFTREELNALLYFVKSVDDPNYSVFINNKQEITKILPENIYNQLDSQIKLNEVIKNAIDEKAQAVKDEYFIDNATKLVGAAEAKNALNRLKMNYYPTVNKLDEYEKAALEYYENTETADVAELDKAALIFAEYSKNPNSLKKALMWAQSSVMRGENEQNTYTLAKIYYKLNDKENAKNYAEYAKSILIQKGKDASFVDELLSQINLLQK